MRLLGAACLVGAIAWWWTNHRAHEQRRRDGSFATSRSIGPLRARGDLRGRVVLGRFATTRWRATRVTLAAPRGDSVLVIGPTQTGKTSSLVLPALLSWEGPVLAASVKDDLVRESAAWRRGVGTVGVLDPSRGADALGRSFDPVALSPTWEEATCVAAALCDGGVNGLPGSDAAFWGQLAAKLLGPLLLAAHLSDRDLNDVARWIDARSEHEALATLVQARAGIAEQWLEASFDREERQLASVLSTLEAVVAPLLRGAGAGMPIDPHRLVASRETLYLCAPAHEQRRYRPMFTAVTQLVLEAAFTRARQEGGTLNEGLLVVLDEAAAIAPLEELDVLASTCSSHGITLLTCFQDLAQIRGRYGERSSTVVNNHRTRVLLSGLADPGAAELLGALAGSARSIERRDRPNTSTQDGERRALIEPHELRQLPPHTAVVVSGRHRPVRLALRAWWRHPVLRERGPRPSGSLRSS
jgi:type IV secretory pathway TraG/TraD family ATPase VirD4